MKNKYPKFEKHLEATHYINTAEQQPWELKAIERTSNSTKCPICNDSHFLTYYQSEKHISYYYCKNKNQWINNLEFNL